MLGNFSCLSSSHIHLKVCYIFSFAINLKQFTALSTYKSYNVKCIFLFFTLFCGKIKKKYSKDTLILHFEDQKKDNA